LDFSYPEYYLLRNDKKVSNKKADYFELKIIGFYALALL